MKIAIPKSKGSIQAFSIGTVPPKHLAEDSHGVSHAEILGDGVPTLNAASVSALREFFELLDGWDRSHEKDSRDLCLLHPEHGRESVSEHTSGGSVGLADRTPSDRVRPRHRLTSEL